MAKMMEVVLRDEIYRFFFLMNMMVKLMVTMAVEKMVMRAVKEDGEGGDKGCKGRRKSTSISLFRRRLLS